jgi:hypothetical protein
MAGDLDVWLDIASGDDSAFVARAFRLLLRRDAEPTAVEEYVRLLASGDLSRTGLLQKLAATPEFAEVALLDDAVARALAQRGRPRELTAPAWSGERAIEIPWCLARHDGERRVLDVGYAFAEPAHVAGLLALGAEVTGVDLAEREVPGMTTVAADVRDLPFGDDSFELVFCISTLEHVGRDTHVYNVDAPRDEEGDVVALRELGRVAERVLVSVPAGVPDDQGWQVQRSPEEWVERFERAGLVVYEDELYVRSDDGWRSSTLAEAQAAEYRVGESAGAILVAELRPKSVGERLRLAVRDARHRDQPRRSTLA